MESVIKIAVMIVGGTIAISLLTNPTTGTSVSDIGGAFANILSAMRGGATTASTASPQGPQPSG